MNPVDIDEEAGVLGQYKPAIEILFDGKYIEKYIPEYHSEKAAGFDLKADIEKKTGIPSGETRVIGTGLKFGLPLGYELQIRSRSGLAAKSNVFVMNSPGTIDEDYQGEIMIILTNLGRDTFFVEPGMRIAQAVLSSYTQGSFDPVDALTKTTVRGTGGLGSTKL